MHSGVQASLGTVKYTWAIALSQSQLFPFSFADVFIFSHERLFRQIRASSLRDSFVVHSPGAVTFLPTTNAIQL